MSRIGKRVVRIPKGVKVSLANGTFQAEGPKGKLSVAVPEAINVDIAEDIVTCSAKREDKDTRAKHGLIRNLINNVLIGVHEGYKKTLVISGVGYKAQLAGKKLTLNLGYSHIIDYTVPQEVTVTVPQQTQVIVEGIDNVIVGRVAATIRSFCKPEPYKGKGVSYSDEQIRRKQGKVVG